MSTWATSGLAIGEYATLGGCVLAGDLLRRWSRRWYRRRANLIRAQWRSMPYEQQQFQLTMWQHDLESRWVFRWMPPKMKAKEVKYAVDRMVDALDNT